MSRLRYLARKTAWLAVTLYFVITFNFVLFHLLPGNPVRLLARSGWLGLEVPPALDGAGATFAEVAVVLEEMGRAAAAASAWPPCAPAAAWPPPWCSTCPADRFYAPLSIRAAG